MKGKKEKTVMVRMRKSLKHKLKVEAAKRDMSIVELLEEIIKERK